MGEIERVGDGPGGGRSTLVAVGVVALLLLAVLAVGSRVGGDDGPDAAPTAPSTAASEPSEPEVRNEDATPTVDEDEQAAQRLERVRRVLTNPGVAAEADRAEIDAAVDESTRTGDWVVDEWGTLDPAEVEAGRDVPLVVGQATVDRAGATTFDVVWSVPRSFFADTLAFRVLAADARLVDADFALSLVVIDGRSLPPEEVLDRGTAEVFIGGIATDVDEVRVRLAGQYVVPERSRLLATEDPIGYGLLARSGDITALGHWLPVPTFDPGEFADTGADIGAFPASTWSVVVVHPGLLVSGGNEGSCVSPQAALDNVDTADETECTWLRARNLRDLSAVVIGSGDQDNPFVYLDRPGESLGLVELHEDDRSAIVDETAAAWTLFHDLFGPLPWGELDVVAVPLRPAASGMEFPGMIWVDPGVLAADGGFGSYVLTHEVAHQWFHGLLGNGSLSDPVIDESLAQYGSYLAVRDQYGQAAADRLDAEHVTGRYERGLARGDDEAPAMPVAAFRSEPSYGSAVYGRAGAAWIDADRDLGTDRVAGAVAEVVSFFRLAPVATDQFLAALREADPELGDRIAVAWGRPQ